MLSLSTPAAYAQRHLRFGWWSLFVFAALGLTLETLHGFKVAMYLDVANETRRLMWTLAHAHGTLLGVVHVLVGVCAPNLPLKTLASVSWCLLAASILLPGGFFLGGIAFYSGDPGLGVLLVPAGAVLALAALFQIARAQGTAPDVNG